jgi:hypothetical protein
MSTPAHPCGKTPTTRPPCSFGLSATSQQYFSLRTNQPLAISQQYFSLRMNHHQPSATNQTNRPVIVNPDREVVWTVLDLRGVIIAQCWIHHRSWLLLFPVTTRLHRVFQVQLPMVATHGRGPYNIITIVVEQRRLLPPPSRSCLDARKIWLFNAL